VLPVLGAARESARQAILLPALSATRRTATHIQCGSNIKQLGLGYMTLAEANNGYYPLNNRSLNNNRSEVYRREYENGASNQDQLHWTNGVIYEDLQGVGVELASFQCPSRGEEEIRILNRNVRFGYFIQAARFLDSGHYGVGDKKWVSPFSIEDDSELVMMSDILTYADNNPDISTSYSHGPSGEIYIPGGNRPGGGPPVPIEDTKAAGGYSLYNDGSAHWVPVTQMKVRFGAAAKNAWRQYGFWYDSPAYDQANN